MAGQIVLVLFALAVAGAALVLLGWRGQRRWLQAFLCSALQAKQLELFLRLAPIEANVIAGFPAPRSARIAAWVRPAAAKARRLE